MKNILLYLLFATGILMTVAPAHAITTRPGEVLKVVKLQPQPLYCYDGTDTSLQSNEYDYNLKVLLGAKVYDVQYETAFDFLPSNLVDGANIEARIGHHQLYLETPDGELATVILHKHTLKTASEAKLSDK